jgi:hypothetical protein
MALPFLAQDQPARGSLRCRNIIWGLSRGSVYGVSPAARQVSVGPVDKPVARIKRSEIRDLLPRHLVPLGLCPQGSPPDVASLHPATLAALFCFQSPALHFSSGKISGTSLPLCVQGSTVHSSLVLRSLITAVLCGPSVNMNRDAGAAMV